MARVHMPRRWRAPAWLRLDYGGVVVGLMFVALSVTPSLLPRPLAWQGVISGLSFAVGYLAGMLAWTVVQRLVRWRSAWLERWAWWIVLAVFLGASVVLARYAESWQNGIRIAVGMERIPGYSWVRFTIIVLVTAAVCIALGKAVAGGARSVARRVQPAVARTRGDLEGDDPRTARAARAIAVVVAAAVVFAVTLTVTGAGLWGLSAAYDRKYGDPDASLAPPASPLRSSGPGSAVPWETVGRAGSEILAQGPDAAAITAVTGAPALEPIRVYVGLASADTYAARAQLAVDELVRTGAADRRVVVVAGTTGTGWLDPAAIDGLEYLYGGDTALAAVQYATTPSWVSEVFAEEVPVEATSALFEAVHAWWAGLPADDRPLLVAYGLSLGSKATQATFDGLDDMASRLDGGVFAGTPWNTPLWRSLTSARDAGTAMVLPTLDAGRHVRWMSTPADLRAPAADWIQPRFVYLQHGNDPVVWLELSVFWRPPEWLEPGERSALVSPDMHWIPVVSGFQAVVDVLMAEAVPQEYGHRYGTAMIDAWMAVIGDPGLEAGAVQAIRDRLATYETLEPVSQ